MIGYVTLGSNDMPRALAFYEALLAEIGAQKLMALEENGFTVFGVGMDQPMLAITAPHNGQAAQPGNGTMVALLMPSRAKVDALHAKALALGGSDEGAPGLREPAEMGFYGAYFRDLDGNKLCAFKVGPDS